LAPAQPKLLTAQPELLTAQAEITPQVTPQIEPQDAVPVSGPASSPPLAAPLPEQPAIAARKTLPAPPQSVAAAGVSAPQETKLAALEPRSTRRPAIPGRSVPPLVVMRDFAKQIPQSHVTLPVKRQKESFIAITLPLILAANEEISQRRKAIERAVSRGDQAGVVRWARLYRIETEGRSIAEIERQLLLRADFVPVSLALAQAAIESGWGTSRFALQGNALFGQWAWQKDAGLKPARASNSQAVVRSFPNLFGSVRAYMHNLNTHPRYAGFRARRHLLRGRTKADLGYQLSNFLDGYAEIGEVYVAKLKALIRSNDLGRYEAAMLR
jgi:Bax protein